VLPNKVFDLLREIRVHGHDLHVPRGDQPGNTTPERLRDKKLSSQTHHTLYMALPGGGFTERARSSDDTPS
jgi:hypothetical protein